MEVNWNNVVSPTRNDIVFDGRNQLYGAFQIRRTYSNTVMWIIVGMIAASSLILGAKVLFDLNPY